MRLFPVTMRKESPLPLVKSIPRFTTENAISLSKNLHYEKTVVYFSSSPTISLNKSVGLQCLCLSFFLLSNTPSATHIAALRVSFFISSQSSNLATRYSMISELPDMPTCKPSSPIARTIVPTSFFFSDGRELNCSWKTSNTC